MCLLHVEGFHKLTDIKFSRLPCDLVCIWSVQHTHVHNQAFFRPEMSIFGLVSGLIFHRNQPNSYKLLKITSNTNFPFKNRQKTFLGYQNPNIWGKSPSTPKIGLKLESAIYIYHILTLYISISNKVHCLNSNSYSNNTYYIFTLLIIVL